MYGELSIRGNILWMVICNFVAISYYFRPVIMTALRSWIATSVSCFYIDLPVSPHYLTRTSKGVLLKGAVIV